MLIGYARVSTRDQKPHLQLDALQEAGCERIFKETVSGAKRERPELQSALDFMRAGDTLVIWKLDRLARSTRQLLDTVEGLAQRGIGLKALTQEIDTTTAGGRLIFTVFSAIAEFEREIIRERTRAGLDAAHSRGHKGGRPRALVEKDLKQARALLTDPEITVEDVARRLGVGSSTLYRYLPAARQTAQEMEL
ncbi:recombinase [Methylomonas lenta]|jgi:DNA invertase Pin-like site-specific DNA recombinase|uniref:Recombinase n=1 Tax=Methylomonas lenta TaxID=980561 RepID=A0A177NUJ5_9GAMM|nr:recombinase family protein [Methylomonas lenta]OAI21645.1 recombinase [Methylomonas lenta]